MNMPWVARDHAPWFGRTLDALQRRLPEVAALLDGLVARTLDAQAVENCWRAVRALSPGNDPGPALRRTRQLIVLAIIERDVRGQAALEEVCAAISAWARLAISIAVTQAGAELAASHGVPLDANGQPQDLLVIGMGKLGGNELNVSSDVDLVFVHREAGQTQGIESGRGQIDAGECFIRMARRVATLLSDITEDGFVFRVDTRLRPNGDAGPLVVNLSMLEQYFYEQGREWERFAWLKADVIADSGLAGSALRAQDEAQLISIVEPFVYRRYLDFAAIDAMRSLHALIRAEAGRRDRRHDSRDGGGIDVKLGRGGIREVEFCAQLFQVVRGGRDAQLRDRRTLHTLEALAERRLIDPDSSAGLAQAYRLLRRIEHAVQYQEDAQTHRLPDLPVMHRRIAALLGFEPEAFEAALQTARSHVASVFDSLLADGQGDRPSATETLPKGLALDAQGLARVEALHQGRRYRTAKVDTQQRIDQLLDQALREGVTLDSTCRQPGADTGDSQSAVADTVWLGRLIDLLETVAGRPAYLALLVQFPGAYRQLLNMIGQARWAADYLTRHPIVLDELLDGQILEPGDFEAWEWQTRAALDDARLRQGEPDVERQMNLMREAHHAQLFRLLTQDLAGVLSVERLSDHLSELADRVLSIAIGPAWMQVRQRHRETPKFAVIAYGRLGGKELGYASDLDLVFIHDDDDPQAQYAYSLLVQRLSAWLSTRTAAGQLFEVDLRLRPNGEAGVLVSSLAAFAAYQRESAWVWEHQALTRARFAAGDATLGAQFETLRRDILAMPRDRAKLRQEVIEMRARMLEGHPNRSAEFDIKHDPGGMVDIEFIVQYLVLAHSADHPELLDNAGNIALLDRAACAGLIDSEQARACAQAYRDYRRMQHRLRLNDARYARVAQDRVTVLRDAVLGVWQSVLEPGKAGPAQTR